jgi:hypothetical protein
MIPIILTVLAAFWLQYLASKYITLELREERRITRD